MSKLWYLIRTASVKQGYKLCRGAGGGWGRQANRIFQTRTYIWTSCLSMIKHRNLGTRQGKWCFNKVWDRLVSCILHYPCKKGGEGSPKVADQSVQAAVCVWAAAKGGTQVKQGGFKWARLPLQKMQRSLKGSMLKWVAYVLIFKDRKRCTRLHLSASISLALP